MSADNDVLVELVGRSAKGDSVALSALVSEMIPDVRREASKYAFVPGVDIDDLFQEGMIGILSAVRTYKAESGASFRTYASVCARNKIISAVKSASGGKSVHRENLVSIDESYIVNPGLTYDDDLIIKDECAKLLDFIETKLSSKERGILKLFLSGASYGEIAFQIGSSPKSVDNALQRVRQKLKKYH